MTAVHKLRNQLLSLVYRVSWSVTRPIKLAEGYLRVPWQPYAYGRSDSSSDEASDDVEVAAATGDPPPQQSSGEQVDCCLSLRCLCLLLQTLRACQVAEQVGMPV